ncbi:MAG: ABC transporter substrate-binding protein [Sphingomonadaceae bacterium]|nr:ABC transporter substrate-binding protein [Sphingomonadaceae bacterium]
MLKLSSLLLLAIVSACGSSDSTEFNVVTIGSSDDPFETGVRLSLAGQLSRASLAEGLVAFDEQGRVIPALAERWIVTDDGKSYIFRLRSGTWRDGSQITARTGTAALRGAVKSLRGTALALDLNGIDEIREMAGRVIEIRLTYPMPHFLQLLAQPELGLTRRGAGAGPMRLDREEDTARLTPIPPEELGMAVIATWLDRARSVSLTSVSGEEALTRFNKGEVDLVMGGRIADFPRTASVGILRGTIQLDPVDGLFGLQIRNTKGFLGDAANREALAMAIDRKALISPFGLDGWTATTRIVSPGLEEGLDSTGERWQDMTLEDRRALAASRVALWRKDKGSDVDIRLSVWLPQGPGSDMLITRLAENFGAIGVAIERAEPDQTGDLTLIDEVARYPSATWFLNRFNCKVRKGGCDRKADAKLAQARKVSDPAERAALIAEAEILLSDANVFIPFGSPIRWALVRGDVRGFSTNRWGWHPLMSMALLPK